MRISVSKDKFGIIKFSGIRGFILFISLVYFPVLVKAQSTYNGINITGLERVWDAPVYKSQSLEKEIMQAVNNGYDAVRLPLAIEYFLASSPNFLKELRETIRFMQKKKIPLILVYFDHGLNEENADIKSDIIADNWRKIIQSIGKNNSYLYLEIVNEPNLNPSTWERIWPKMVKELRSWDPDIPIIIGATNFNSLYELSRTSPPDLENVIYTFHFYEPYIFTHQGTPWTGDQNSTMGLPYPYSYENMPSLNPKAYGTVGEVNYRDYNLTGNKVAVLDKISQIAEWAEKNGLELWCTEYGVSINADPNSRKNYLKDVRSVLNQFHIQSFVWEWEGNFGVRELKD